MVTKIKKRNCQADEAPSGYGFDRLPQDVILDIASRFPITSLLLFTFVRKSFYKLSHDPELVNLHLSRTVKNDPCIILKVDNKLYFLEFSDHGMEEGIVRKISTPPDYISLWKVVGSCNGLLCTSDHSDSLYVYNRFTTNYKQLPRSVKPQVRHKLVFGFGFHPITKEYKFIKIIHYDPRKIVNQMLKYLVLVATNGEVLGKLFTALIQVIKELFLGGCLAVALHYKGAGLEIWVMRDYNVKESWVKEFKIGAYTPNPNSVTQRRQLLLKVLCLLNNGKLLPECNDFPYCRDLGYLVSFDPQSGVFTRLKFERMPVLFETIVHVGCLNWIDFPSADFYKIRPSIG
ncbi:F-box protein At3g07870-like [Lycium barbarum]|uniref:F-box protein At3g07870-like n=1 Tax=Lycium barbarum TaxID=112863 RepID=UPI00293EE7E0|nr:F-box protein At3g07870-like [Lycium barbarum]